MRPFLLLLICGCFSYQPPSVTAPTRQDVVVAAPISRTWNAAVDVFAARNLPVAQMDRASGFLTTAPLATKESVADCGVWSGVKLTPDRVTYSVLVRGDSTRATVRASIRAIANGVTQHPDVIECKTLGVWESAIESEIREKATH